MTGREGPGHPKQRHTVHPFSPTVSPQTLPNTTHNDVTPNTIWHHPVGGTPPHPHTFHKQTGHPPARTWTDEVGLGGMVKVKGQPRQGHSHSQHTPCSYIGPAPLWKASLKPCPNKTCTDCTQSTWHSFISLWSCGQLADFQLSVTNFAPWLLVTTSCLHNFHVWLLHPHKLLMVKPILARHLRSLDYHLNSTCISNQVSWLCYGHKQTQYAMIMVTLVSMEKLLI